MTALYSDYLSLEDVKSVPRLEADYFFLTDSDYNTWRTYARGLAVEANVETGVRKTVARIIDQYPDPNIDFITGPANLNTLKLYVPKIKTITEIAEDKELQTELGIRIGQPIRLQALTSEEYGNARRVVGEQGNTDWYFIAIGLKHPHLSDDLEEAIKVVQGWSPTNVRLIAAKVFRLTVHPGSLDKKNESDAFRDFFDAAD